MKSLLREYGGLFVALVLLVVIFGLSADHFFTATTFRTIANQIPDITIVAVGMTFVLIIAGIDLSVGSVLALAGAVFGVALVNWELSLWVAIPLAVLMGLLCGLINGFITNRWKLPAFIVTLGMLEVARGAAYRVTDSRTLYIGKPAEAMMELNVFGLSLPFVLAIVMVVLAQFVLQKTVFGRYVIAVGNNEEAVKLSGIRADRVKLAVYALCGFLVGLAAVVQSARLSSSNPNAGVGMELSAIAAVVIGGTSLMGGRGSVISTFIGVILIAVLNTGLAQVGAEESTKRMITGVVIVAAVILDYYRDRMRKVALAKS